MARRRDVNPGPAAHGAVARDPALFERWWKRRDLPDDRRIVRQAVSAGLVAGFGGLLSLTDAGKRLRREGEALRGVGR